MGTRLAHGLRSRTAAILTGLAVLLGLLTALTSPARADDSNHPGAPTVIAVTDTTVTVSWTAPTGPIDVVHYQALKNESVVGTTTGTTFTYTGLVPSRRYALSAVAVASNGGRWASNAIAVTTTGTTPSMPAKPVVMGVFTENGSHERGFHAKELVTGGSAAKLTHLTYAYGTVANGQCGIGDHNAALNRSFTAGNSVSGQADTANQPLRGYLNQLRELKSRYPNLKLLWSFGGPEQTGSWTGARQNPAAFAASCAQLLNDPRWAGLFDGLDLAVEFPICPSQGTCDLGAAAAVTPLTRELRSALGSSKLLTVTLGRKAGKSTYGRADLPGAATYIDWYNVKAFDYYHPHDTLWSHATAPQAPLVNWEVYDGGRHVSHDIWNLTERGIHPNKLVLGIPTHAWGWKGITSRPWPNEYNATGPANGASGPGLDDYRAIKPRCAPTGELGKGAIAVCGTEFWTYDTPATITHKAAYMKQNGMGGAFLSNLRGDTAGGELLTAVTSALTP
ncbi:glycosyl hydrolase family 18 protein [Streptomyces sp. NPDC059130]|uniref:glycosyl hydrolase family 18 protein n=1 Tax=unclassified Streptomyces TaxID=2593676 RepID=UPI0036CEE678